MAFEHKINSGSAFKNDNGQYKSVYSGEANIEGTMYFLDIYINKSQKGEEYLALRFKEKAHQPARQQQFIQQVEQKQIKESVEQKPVDEILNIKEDIPQ